MNMKNTTEIQTVGNIRWSDHENGNFGFVGKMKAFYAYESVSSASTISLLCHLPNPERANCDPFTFHATLDEAKSAAEEIFAQWLKDIGLEVKKPHRCDNCQKWIDEVCP